jgi:DNA repair protein RadD
MPEAYIFRDYQDEAVSAGIDYFKKPTTAGGALMVEPTGSGKSLIIAGIARGLDAPTIVFQPSKEILDQNYKKLIDYGERPAIYSAACNKREISNLTLATIGSVVNKTELFEHFKYVIVDECHFVNAKDGMYKRFLDIVGDKLLGLTATPYRLSSDSYGGAMLKFLTRTRPKVFHRLIHYTQNADLFARGYLAKLEYASAGGFDSNVLKVNTTGAEYDRGSVRAYMQEIDFKTGLKQTVLNAVAAGRPNILVFTQFIEEAANLAAGLPGICATVTAETPKAEREDIIAGFKTGAIRVVANVGVLTHGFDFPALSTVILGRPTMSLGLYYQMIGRGIRPHPTKASCHIIDLCDNIRRFGPVESLKLVAPRPGLWHIENGDGKQLTNVYYSNIKRPRNIKDSTATMPWGKHRGMLLSDMCRNNFHYVRWLLEKAKISGSLRKAFEEILYD